MLIQQLDAAQDLVAVHLSDLPQDRHHVCLDALFDAITSYLDEAIFLLLVGQQLFFPSLVSLHGPVAQKQTRRVGALDSPVHLSLRLKSIAKLMVDKCKSVMYHKIRGGI